ncbi:PRC-barrel domain containing protein [Streptomyces sp. NPDC057695]|uniref:PRC-barrel domain containing protein n=1 Tax=Streptomyces sp. NPDC057695 TaxID=3346217 RepID=UPI0036C8CB4D
MANDPWGFHPSCGELSDLDLTEWRVDAADGRVGEVDTYSDVTGEAFLVVEADGWIFGKVMIPAGAVTHLDRAGRTLRLDLSRDLIQDAPQYLPDEHRADPEYRAELAEYYEKAGPC